MLGYITRNPCRGVQLPGIEKAEDEAMFLTHAEFSLIMEGMGERYKAFTNFLVMTGTRFGEVTALTVADVDLLSKPPTARINKAWKRDGQNQFYIGATKTGPRRIAHSLSSSWFVAEVQGVGFSTAGTAMVGHSHCRGAPSPFSSRGCSDCCSASPVGGAAAA